MNYTRRKFISLSLLGASGLLIPSFLSGKNISGFYLNNSAGLLQTALELARQGHMLRLSKSFTEAEAKYQQAIQIMPGDPRFYDGLRKVFAMQKGKHQLIVEMYQKAYKNYPNSSAFATRLGNAYQEIELGNKALAKNIREVSGIASLSEESQKLFEKALLLKSENKDASASLVKHKSLKGKGAYSSDARKNPAIKSLKSEHYKSSKDKLKVLTVDKLQKIIAKSKTKKRRALPSNEQENRLRNIEKTQKLFSQLLIGKHLVAKEFTTAITVAENIYQKYPKDTKTLGLLKKMYTNNKKWNQLLTLSKERYNTNPTVWSGLGLMKSIELQVQNGGGSISEAISLGNSLLEKCGENMVYKISVLSMIASNYAAVKQYDNALQKLDLVKALIIEKGFGQPTLANQFFADYGLILAEKGDGSNAEKVIKTGLGVLSENQTDDFAKIFSQKILEKANHRRVLEVALAKVYQKTNPSKLPQQLQHILNVYPDDAFAKKRI